MKRFAFRLSEAPPRVRTEGYTIVEVMVALTLVGSLLMSLVYAQVMLTRQMNVARATLSVASDSVTTLTLMEQSIRDAEKVLRAGVDNLEVETRYNVDLDDEIEKIWYYRSSGNLYRAIADGSSPYGTGELILENVTEFDARALKIIDSFDATEYTTVATEPTGDPEDADTVAKVEYLVRELGQVDTDFSLSYAPVSEDLALTSVLSAKTITVSPELDREGLAIQVDFTPESDDAEYRPIIYGNENSESLGISVVFADDRTIRLKVSEASTTVSDENSGITWEPGIEYRVWLEMREDVAVAHLRNLTAGTRRQLLGKASSAAIDRARVHFQTTSPGKVGRWDNLELAYPIIEVHFGVTTPTGVDYFYGGANQRNP
ncbi:MAG: hypothetical protein AAF488_05820 [Planctomycetota bacterium]